MSDILHTEEQELHHNCCRYMNVPINLAELVNEEKQINATL